VKLAAELKMLRLLQTNVNGRTKKVNGLPMNSRKRSKLALQTSKKQARVEELTRKLARKLQKEDELDEHNHQGWK